MRFKKIFFLLFIPILFLSGCNKQSYNIKINEDGSSSLALSVTVDKDSYDSLRQYIKDEDINDINALFKKDSERFKKAGFNIETINDSIDIGFKASREFLSPSDFNRSMKKFKKEKLIDSDLTIKADKNFYQKTYVLKGKIRYTKDPDFEKVLKKAKAEKLDSRIDFSKMKAEAIVSIPGNIKYKNSDNFTANYDSSGENIYIKSSIFNNKLKYTGVGIGFLIILVAFMKWLAYFLTKDKKRNEAKTKIAKEMKKKSKDKMKKTKE